MAVTNQVVHEVPLVEPGATCDCAHVEPHMPSAVPGESTHSVLHAAKGLRSVFISTKLMSEFLHYAKVRFLHLLLFAQNSYFVWALLRWRSVLPTIMSDKTALVLPIIEYVHYLIECATIG
jgi:hypothetical protein